MRLSWPFISMFWWDKISSSIMEETWASLKSNKRWSRSLNALWTIYLLHIEWYSVCYYSYFFLCKMIYNTSVKWHWRKDLLLRVFWFWLVTASTRAYHTTKGLPRSQLVGSPTRECPSTAGRVALPWSCRSKQSAKAPVTVPRPQVPLSSLLLWCCGISEHCSSSLLQSHTALEVNLHSLWLMAMWSFCSAGWRFQQLWPSCCSLLVLLYFHVCNSHLV